MIGIYKDGVTKRGDTRLTMAYRGLTINSDSYPVSIVAVSHSFDAVLEPKVGRDGMEGYEAHKMSTLVRIEGMVKADNLAALHDRIEILNAAFDPVISTENDTADVDIGYMPFTFSVPTADTANYASGLIPMQYYGRSLQLPVSRISKFEGNEVQFGIILQCIDPRRYLQTGEDEIRTGVGDIVVANSLASYSSWPIVTIVCTTSTGILSLRRVSSNDDRTLFLDLSVQDGKTIIVDMNRREILVDGIVNMIPNTPGGDYWWIAPGTNTITVANFTGLFTGTVEVDWTRAFV